MRLTFCFVNIEARFFFLGLVLSFASAGWVELTAKEERKESRPNSFSPGKKYIIFYNWPEFKTFLFDIKIMTTVHDENLIKSKKVISKGISEPIWNVISIQYIHSGDEHVWLQLDPKYSVLFWGIELRLELLRDNREFCLLDKTHLLFWLLWKILQWCEMKRVKACLHVPSMSVSVSGTFDLINVMYKQLRRTALKPFLNGTKNDGVDGVRKRSLRPVVASLIKEFVLLSRDICTCVCYRSV